MKKPDDHPMTLEERLIGAFISAFAMVCTIVAFSFIFLVITAKSGRFEGAQLLFQVIFSKVSLIAITGTAVLGFLLSFDKMVNLFGSLWGTNPEHELFATNKFVIAIAFAAALGIAILLIRQ